jgi:hypothetical protein
MLFSLLLGATELAGIGAGLSIFNSVTKLFNVPLLSVTTSAVAAAHGASTMSTTSHLTAAQQRKQAVDESGSFTMGTTSTASLVITTQQQQQVVDKSSSSRCILPEAELEGAAVEVGRASDMSADAKAASKLDDGSALFFEAGAHHESSIMTTADSFKTAIKGINAILSGSVISSEEGSGRGGSMEILQGSLTNDRENVENTDVHQLPAAPFESHCVKTGSDGELEPDSPVGERLGTAGHSVSGSLQPAGAVDVADGPRGPLAAISSGDVLDVLGDLDDLHVQGDLVDVTELLAKML